MPPHLHRRAAKKNWSKISCGEPASALAQLKGVATLKDYFARHGARPYEYRLYETLAQLYLEQQRIEDAVNVYRSFVAQHPNSPQAPDVRLDGTHRL